MNATKRAEPATKNTNAGILAGLKFTTATKPSKAQEQHRSPRDVVIEFLDQQIALAKADIDGKTFSITKVRFQKDDAGKSRKVEVSVTPRRAYWQHGAEWLASLKYGNLIVELSPGNPSIVAGASLMDVVETFGIVRKAVEAGECDAQIAVAAEKAKRKAPDKANS